MKIDKAKGSTKMAWSDLLDTDVEHFNFHNINQLGRKIAPQAIINSLSRSNFQMIPHA